MLSFYIFTIIIIISLYNLYNNNSLLVYKPRLMSVIAPTFQLKIFLPWFFKG